MELMVSALRWIVAALYAAAGFLAGVVSMVSGWL